jgi:signal transduction histidine kinase
MSIQNRLAILLIEDSIAFARAVQVILRHKAPFEFDLTHATSLEDGLERITGRSFDIALLDLSLPDSHELNSLRSLRRTAPLLPIIVLTGNEDEATAIESLQEGAQDYVLKMDLEGRALARSILYAIERGRLLHQRDEFMAALVHDIKNPLIGTDKILQLILDQHFGEVQPALQEITGLLKESNESILRLLMNLLEIQRYDSTVQRFNFETLDLNDVVCSSLKELTPLAQMKRLNVRSSLQLEQPKVNADARAMQRVLLNLIGNSIKFTPDGGSVDVAVDAGDQLAIVTVKDSGEGISIDEQQYLFQRFYQSSSGKEHALGTGLGLYVCRQIVEAHMGNIRCDSSNDTGTTMIIELPRQRGN